MKNFALLFEDLDGTTSTNEKIHALKKFFLSSSPEDSMWTILLLTGKTSKRVLTSKDLKDFFLHKTQYPEWLFEECYSHVGDTAETLSLLAQSLGLTSKEKKHSDESLSTWMEDRIPSLAKIKDKTQQSEILFSWWNKLTSQEVFILSKLITGAFRVGVSERSVVRALAEAFNRPSDQIAHRLTGDLSPGASSFQRIIAEETVQNTFSQPYPFCLAHPFTEKSRLDFKASDWCFEWKYDGIRAQVLKRNNQVWIWSRGEEQITETFPDLAERFKSLPEGTVLDGEIVGYLDEKVLPFQDLQKRLGRKKISSAILKEVPAGFIAYDCLEKDGHDLRPLALSERKEILKGLIQNLRDPRVLLSEVLSAKSLPELEKLRAQSREHDAEGLMLKLWTGPYSVGRKTGNWWKFKVDPLTLDAVLIYAQAGTGRRSNLYTDYTFALWNDEKELVPFAKAYSGLDQAEIDKLDSWIRRHTKEKFGPVRSVQAEMVFEIGFEGIGLSKRHKSGIAVRFPRILRWRHDKKPEDADSLKNAHQLLDELRGPL